MVETHNSLSISSETMHLMDNDGSERDDGAAKADSIRICNEQQQLNDSSLEKCRHNASLVDELDEEDNSCENTNEFLRNDISSTNTIALHCSEARTMDNIVELLNQNQAASTANENFMNTNIELSVDVPTTTPVVIVPVKNYLQLRRLTSSTATPFLQQPPLFKNNAHNWDQLVRSGTRMKTLLSDAIEEVKNTMVTMQSSNSNSKRAREESTHSDDSNVEADMGDGAPSNQRSRVVAVADFTVELAREKTAQVMQLQRVRNFYFFFSSAL
jgi:hypothetical protein